VERFVHRSTGTGGVRRHERAALTHILDYLRRIGIAEQDDDASPEPATVEWVVEEFSRYLLHDRALAEATLQGYCPRVRLFLCTCFTTGRIDFSRLSVRDVRDFVLHHARGRAPKSTQLMLSALRSFLRYLYLHGLIAIPLAEHVPSVVSWRQTEPPKWLPDEDIERVLNGCNRDAAIGQRNYAMLLLLARLGLRAGEVLSLELDDIRWETAELCVCGKGAKRKRFPLSEEVGAAIAAYLKNARPRCDSRRLFLRAKAPYRGLGHASTVDTVVSRALARAGLDPPMKGAHLFRHSLATRMLRNGATLTEIGQILHHANPDTTSIYAKVDIEGLRGLAMPWPGEQP
jgi:site-specific recombinase XerD